MDIAALLQELDLRNIPYTMKGKRIMVRCLFHDDKNPSMSVNKNTGYYECYGCGKKGSWAELCAELGIECEDEPDSAPLRPRRIVLPEPKRRRIRVYPELANSLHADKRAYAYLKGRGITIKTAKLYDTRYRKEPERVVIPIRTSSGELVSLYERDIRGGEKRKTTDTDSKSVLFGLDVVKSLKLPFTPLIVVEGEIDSMSVVQAGYACVSSMGLNVTEAQADILARFRVHYIVDADVRLRGDFYAVSNRLKNMVRKRSGSMTVSSVSYKDCKDCNDIIKLYGTAALRKYIDGVLP